MRARAVLKLVLVMLLCGACMKPVSVQPREEAAPPPVLESELTAIARDVLEEVNRVRRANGLDALREDAALNRAAADHSAELAERRTLDHLSTKLARRTMTMRIDAAGGSWSAAAENLANVSGPASSVPARTAQLWLDSPGHNRNMLESSFTHTGVGVAIDGRGMWYVTQLYVLPRARR